MDREAAGDTIGDGAGESVLISWSSLSFFIKAVKEMGFVGAVRVSAPTAMSAVTRVEMASGTAEGLEGTDDPLYSKLFICNLSCNCTQPPAPSFLNHTSG